MIDPCVDVRLQHNSFIATTTTSKYHHDLVYRDLKLHSRAMLSRSSSSDSATPSLRPTWSRGTKSSHPSNCHRSQFSPQTYGHWTTEHSRHSRRATKRMRTASRRPVSSTPISLIPDSMKLSSRHTFVRPVQSSLEPHSKVEARLETLRSRLGDTLQIPEVQTAIDILGEMAGPDSDCDIIDQFVNCPHSLFDQIAGMKSFETMRVSSPNGWSRIEAQEGKDTTPEGYWMSGALPTDTNPDGTQRDGRLVGVKSEDMKDIEDFVR